MPPIAVDTDPGVDDALALLAAWGTPALAVEAITTVAGNVPVSVATVNVFRLLALVRPQPLPVVAAGAAEPLAQPLRTATDYHGEDGLGDLGDWPDVRPVLAPDGAVPVILDAARRHARALTLVALGPLTNLALAIAADGAAMRGIGRVVAMGGAVDVRGNVTADAEFNLHVDPAAAARVFEAGLALDLVALDATRQAVLERAALEAALAPVPGAVAERVRRFTAGAFRRDDARGTRGMVLHDPLAMALAADPSLATWQPVRLGVREDGATRRVEGSPNVRLARVVDTPRFLRAFLEALCRACS